MIRRPVRTCLVGAIALTVPFATAQTVVENFEDGLNQSGWSYFGSPGVPIEVIEASGGNPGRWLHSTCNSTTLECLDTFAPQLRTPDFENTSPFLGNYRAANVASIGCDLILLDVNFSAGGRPLTLILRSFGETPDFFDDTAVYFIGSSNIPVVGEGWKSFDFGVPAQSLTLPAGWRVLQGTGNDNLDWNNTIRDVDQVTFFYGDPELFFIFQQWEPGADNLRVTRSLPGDMNCDGIVSVGDIAGFVLALTDPAGYAAQFPNCDINNADINQDNVVSVGDISGFVALLTGP
ncbi:MAG: hypothetical protein SF069_04700 [Phycisphaerae bacterium]|nr:hypothetical protein [Phycisphaerae bacterium]